MVNGLTPNMMHDNADSLVKEFAWLCALAEWRCTNAGEEGIDPIAAPDHTGTVSLYTDFIRYYQLGEDERLILILALAPHLHPAAMEYLFLLQQQTTSAPMQLVKQLNGSVWPVGFTALWLLAGNDLYRQLQVKDIFDARHFFAVHQVLKLVPSTAIDAQMNGVLQISEEFVDLFTTGQIRKPDFNLHFPARLLQTPLDWDDLVLPSTTLQQIEDIKTWLEYHPVLMNEWNMRRVLKPGYKALFYGPPGTGKTLTAALLGKSSGLDVYRIDLSMVVSKYIGETEKNLEKVFTKAEHKNWILFFDEADALFGKRTGISDAHDKYANQEVSYLLQRLEDYNGLVILSSNQRSNIDDAFARRLQGICYFPIPEPVHRQQLWQNAFSAKAQMEESLSLEWLADKFELAGGGIINVVQYASLQSLQRRETVIRRHDVLEGIRREYNKEGRTL